MVGRPKTDDAIIRRIHSLARNRSLTNADIAESLRAEYGVRAPADLTVKRYAAEARRARAGDRWALRPSVGPDDEQRVLRVLEAVIEETDGRVGFLTEPEAGWLGVITRNAPDLDPWDAFVLAQITVESGDPHELQILLACKPWTEDGLLLYELARDRGIIPRLLFAYTDSRQRYETEADRRSRESASPTQQGTGR